MTYNPLNKQYDSQNDKNNDPIARIAAQELIAQIFWKSLKIPTSFLEQIQRFSKGDCEVKRICDNLLGIIEVEHREWWNVSGIFRSGCTTVHIPDRKRSIDTINKKEKTYAFILYMTFNDVLDTCILINFARIMLYDSQLIPCRNNNQPEPMILVPFFEWHLFTKYLLPQWTYKGKLGTVMLDLTEKDYEAERKKQGRLG
jgi:hypothetical protein